MQRAWIFIFKKIINKICANGLIMKPRVLDKYFEVYGQTDKITPEAGKKGSFITNQNTYYQLFEI